MTALSDLLSQSNVNGWSTREIARQAEKKKHQLAQPTVSKYMGGRHGVPTEPVLAAFSDVLNIPIDKLRTAAGLPAGADSPWTPPTEANRLDLRQRRALEELIRSMVTSETIGEDQDDGQQDAARVDRDAQPDGVKPAADSRESDTSRGMPDADQAVEDLDQADTHDRPWEQDEYGLAAKRGRNRGREARQRQDGDAEDGGA